ncbi:hypothetical protein JXD38_11410 [candidate division WOR-3 bacterium]|nr:hypothetical protein [candidate division WOR-3 bacterium]
MGAFVLASGTEFPGETGVRAVFRRKGFADPAEFSLGNARLLLFPKQVSPVRNWFAAESGRRLFCTGTPVYKGLGYADGMRELLRDWETGSVNQGELTGCYCLLYFDGSRVRMAIDPSGLYHVFSNAGGTVISSSLQAVLVSDGTPHPLNREALIEQLLTGSVAGPDTLCSDIVLLTETKRRDFKAPIADFVALRPAAPSSDDQCARSFGECVERQLALLRGYFRRVRVFSAATGASLGVSGGYDSRLLLLCAREAGVGVHAYTYSSPGHQTEQSVADELTRHAGVPLTPIPVRRWSQLAGQELSDNMQDALFYWDGRTNMTMGTFNDVHTRALRIKAMGPACLGFNGLGGELYRNPEHLPGRSLDFKQWFQYFVMKPGCAAAVRDEKSKDVLIDRLGRKYARLMGVDCLGRIDRHLARRWYRDVWLPYSAGPRLSAENQLSFALMPFADWSVTGESLKATPYIGVGGEFEAAMIRTLDRRAAALTSYYGHSFDRMPLRTRLTDRVRSLVPLGIRQRLHTRKMMAAVSRQRPGRTPVLPPGVEEGLQVLREMDLPVNWDVLLADDVNRDRCFYVAYFLSSFREHLKSDSEGMAGS